VAHLEMGAGVVAKAKNFPLPSISGGQFGHPHCNSFIPSQTAPALDCPIFPDEENPYRNTLAEWR